MPAIYKPGVVQFAPHYNIGAPHDAVNVLYFLATGTGFTSVQLTNMQTAFDTAWFTLWAPCADTSEKYLGSIVTDMSSNTGLQVGNAAFPPGSGSASSSPMTDNTAILLSLRTAVRYRGGHGRVYLPGIASSVVNADGRTVTAARLAGLSSSYNSLVSAMAGISGVNGGPLEHIVWHKHLSSSPNSTEIVLGITPQSVLATQRRRLRKVPRHRRR